jgi:hypothetical protein
MYDINWALLVLSPLPCVGSGSHGIPLSCCSAAHYLPFQVWVTWKAFLSSKSTEFMVREQAIQHVCVGLGPLIPQSVEIMIRS